MSWGGNIYGRRQTQKLKQERGWLLQVDNDPKINSDPQQIPQNLKDLLWLSQSPDRLQKISVYKMESDTTGNLGKDE